jgi:hypothetical protein
MTTLSLQTLRVPKGLWTDLETTVIQQDRAFLTEVARDLGLPVADVLRRCLGTGAPHQIAVLSGSPSDDPGCCPWWSRTDDGCWMPCKRLRLAPTSGCQQHMHTKASEQQRLGSDPHLVALPVLQPFRYEGEVFWYLPGFSVYREDGRIEPTRSFKVVDFRGQRLWVCTMGNGLSEISV